MIDKNYSAIFLKIAIGLLIAGFSNASEISIIAVGDIMLGRHIAKDMAKKGKGYSHPYKLVKNLISSADIAFANLECPISSKGVSTGKKYSFCASTKNLEGLLYAGFDVLALANNHIMDYGPEAFSETLKLLKNKNITYVGAGNNLEEARKAGFFKFANTRIAFLAYDCTFRWSFATDKKAGIAPGRIKEIQQDISKAKKVSDIIIVSFHWGNEYTSTASKFQKNLAHKTIDAGADIIIGHHAHVIQEIEFYKEKPIIYGLGNFIFDQAFGDTRKGLAVKFIIKNKQLNKIVCIPITRNYDKYYPQPAKNQEKKEIVAYILKISDWSNYSDRIKNLITFE
ncbi:CapA family protein [bacterium]|nr:CapA family protein [Candidatus Omnitrophota bacterium]MBU2528676.1 CapA family protein [bacterium]MBU3929433.1 CapA family protein [bacterium]MBU4122569.1 CapA family protein [bacterium]